jgi:hypothetical protein
LLSKQGEIIKIRYDSFVQDGRLIARWTEYELAGKPESPLF